MRGAMRRRISVRICWDVSSRMILDSVLNERVGAHCEGRANGGSAMPRAPHYSNNYAANGLPAQVEFKKNDVKSSFVAATGGARAGSGRGPDGLHKVGWVESSRPSGIPAGKRWASKTRPTLLLRFTLS